MIISRTPFRISFFGGGTDYPVYYNEHGGAVLSTTINKYCYITLRNLPPFFDHKFRIRYSAKEEVQAVDEIQHPSVRECLRFLEVAQGVEIVHTGDIPAMSGIGSSSSFTVGLLNALNALKGKMVTKRKLAYDAIHIEQNMIGECVGSQDQTAAAFGGFNKIEFNLGGDIFVQPMILGKEQKQYLQDCFLFCFTGFSRFSTEIACEQISSIPRKIKELESMGAMVEEAINLLNGSEQDLNNFGRLMHESWKIKRELTNKVSNQQIDQIYDTAINAGALGGKICGAGGGGFLLFFVPPESREKVKEALKDFLIVPFRMESLGSHIIYYSE